MRGLSEQLLQLKMTRRGAAAMGLAGATLAATGTSASAAGPCVDTLTYPPMDALRLPKPRIGFLSYPGMFLMDVMGPLSVFQAIMEREIHFLWNEAGEIQTEDESGRRLMSINAGTSFTDCPDTLDVLIVPGGVDGTFACMQNEAAIDFVRSKAPHCRYVTSVCTGSLVLGAAGLLKGKRATGHWLFRDLLPKFGATESADRVVRDGNVITAGGVTSGLDFALYLTSVLRDPSEAEAIQLYLEYDPAPPFDAGSPASAPKEATRLLQDIFAQAHERATTTADSLAG